MRGHAKLFKLRINLERCRELAGAAATENVCVGTGRNVASSIQRIFHPSLAISGR